MPPEAITSDHNAIDRITSGLNNHVENPTKDDGTLTLEALADFTDPILEKAAEIKFGINDLAEIDALVELRMKKVGDYIDGGIRYVEEQTKRIREEVASMKLNARDAERITNEKLSEVRKFANNLNRQERDEALDALAVLSKKATQVSGFYRSPQQYLARAALGDEKAIRFSQQLSGAGHAELKHFAMMAVATKNVPLGWAVMSELERLPRGQRPFSPQSIAMALVGEKFRACVSTILKAQDAFLTASRRNKEFVSGRANPTAKIEAGLRKMAIAQINDDGSVE